VSPSFDFSKYKIFSIDNLRTDIRRGLKICLVFGLCGVAKSLLEVLDAGAKLGNLVMYRRAQSHLAWPYI
jgi:hypothetical protein